MSARLVPHPEYGYLSVDPLPDAAEIARYYDEVFYSDAYGRCNTAALDGQLRDREFHRAHRGDLVALMESARGAPVAGAQLLDAGCGYGLALLDFRDAGLQVAGFDPSARAVAHARTQGLHVVQAGLHGLPDFGRRFDVVTLLDVLEHVADPVALLVGLRERLLAPGGVLLVEVPNQYNGLQLAARAAHGLPEWWVVTPAHLHYFGVDSLRALIAGCGYRPHACQASFPMELFLLMGENYVADPALGAACHRRRMAFERNLRAHGGTGTLRALYGALADAGLGRTVVCCAVAP